jgi:anti-anti-sigma factor
MKHHGDMLNVEIQVSDDSAELICSGRLVHGRECDQLRRAVDSRAESTISIDLADVESVDAAGLGTLVFLHHQLQAEGRELVLLSAPEYFLGLLRLTSLEGVLSVRDFCAA